MTSKEAWGKENWEDVAIHPMMATGYAVGIALREAVADGLLTEETADTITSRAISINDALLNGKYIVPSAAPDHWVIQDERPAGHFTDPDTLEIGG